jgi:hypothetical protein
LDKIANGINPIDNAPIENWTFLRDERMARCFIYISEVLERVIETENKRGLSFRITEEEMQRIVLPEGKIGVNQFAKCVNEVIDLRRTSKITGVELNRQLKKMGLLSEKIIAKDKRTTITEISNEHGIEHEMRTFNGRQFESVVFNDKGKRSLRRYYELLNTKNNLAWRHQ